VLVPGHNQPRHHTRGTRPQLKRGLDPGVVAHLQFADLETRPVTREQVSVDLDAEVAAILRAHAGEAQLTGGDIVDRAIRAYELCSLIARIRERSDLDEDQAMALVREELRAAGPRATKRA
jgi:hypothetical protein